MSGRFFKNSDHAEPLDLKPVYPVPISVYTAAVDVHDVSLQRIAEKDRVSPETLRTQRGATRRVRKELLLRYGDYRAADEDLA